MKGLTVILKVKSNQPQDLYKVDEEKAIEMVRMDRLVVGEAGSIGPARFE